MILCRSSGEKGTTSFSSSTEAVERAFNRTRRISITMSSDLFFGDWKSHGVSTDHIFFRAIEGNCGKSETVVWRFARSRTDRIGSDRIGWIGRIETGSRLPLEGIRMESGFVRVERYGWMNGASHGLADLLRELLIGGSCCYMGTISILRDVSRWVVALQFEQV